MQTFLKPEEIVDIHNYLLARKTAFEANYALQFKGIGDGLRTLNNRIDFSGRALELLTEQLIETSKCSTNSDESDTFDFDQFDDNILKLIFSFMDLPTLLTCRIMCRRWKLLVTTKLRSSKQHSLQVNLTNKKKPKNSVYQLICLMNYSTYFPSTSFAIRADELGSQHIQAFLNCVGSQIKTLTLTPFPIQHQMSGLAPKPTSISLIKESSKSILATLRRLLTIKAPNIETLELDFMLPGQCSDEVYRFLNQDQLNTKAKAKGLLPHLKHFITTDFISETIFPEIMDAAPHLESFTARSRNCQSNLAILEYFLNTRERIHLLNHIDIFATEETIILLDKLMIKYGNDLQLESIQFLGYQLFHQLPQAMVKHAVHVINQILQVSSGTLKNLAMRHIGFLPGLQFPVMKKLKTLTFKVYNRELLSHPFGTYYYFARGFSMAESFPALETIYAESEVMSSQFSGHLCGILKPSFCEAVPSVKLVSLKGRGSENCEIKESDQIRLNRVFVNATFRCECNTIWLAR